MITLFNLKRKVTNDLMREQLTSVVVPHLRERGFVGKLPSFRRIKDEQCQTLDIQFNKYGKSFAVNLSLVEPSEGFLRNPYGDLKILRSQRLGTRKKRIKRQFNMDHWFKFLKGFVVYRQAYAPAAKSVVSLYESEADTIYQDLVAATQKGVQCIHLDRSNEKTV
jgi:hypothetical protein